MGRAEEGVWIYGAALHVLVNMHGDQMQKRVLWRRVQVSLGCRALGGGHVQVCARRALELQLASSINQ